MASLLDKYRAFIIDLDGVVYLLDEVIEGSSQVIRHLQKDDLPFVFLTNNSVATPQQYVSKLNKFEIMVRPEQIVSSSHAVGRLLDLNYETEGKKAFVIGETGLTVELEARGLELVGPGYVQGVDFVFVGWDRKFNFEKLKAAVVGIRSGARYIVTNTDATYPTPQGLWPGAGSIVAAVTTGSGCEPVVAGKPNPLIVELALSRLGVGAEETLLVGDRIDTDIKAGAEAGVDTMLVLTGVTGEDGIEESNIRPTYIRGSIEAILEA